MKNHKFNAWIRKRTSTVLIVCIAMLTSSSVYAETNKVRLAEQIGLQNLPVAVMVEKRLIEKHAKEMGLDSIEVSLVRVGSGAATNDALLSNSVDFVAAAVGPHLTIWDRTRGNVDVRAVGAMVSLPMVLNTNNPDIKSLEDFGPNDRIAVPAIRVSINAVVLQMASQQLYGDPNRFDPMTVSMSHPDATAALLSGQSHITAHFTVPPFSYMQAQDPSIHTVTTSYEIFGGPHTQFSLYNTRRFKDQNPTVLKAVYAALKEATEIINADKRAAAELYVARYGGLEVDVVEGILNDPNIVYTTTPQNIMKFAEFMHSIGSIRTMPESWKDVYWETVHGEPGS
jgi:NitT/TauT family transport system substrate-binding protein